MPVALREAEVLWEGSLARGAGTLTSGSGALDRLAVTWASRTERPDGKTSPEELIAGAHASCFAMALALVLGENKTPPERLAVSAACTLDELAGVPRITTVELTVRAQVPGLEAAVLESLVGRAADLCPVSNALRGNVKINVRSELAPGVEATPEPGEGAPANGSSAQRSHSREEAEIEDIVRALRGYGVLTRARLLDVCGAVTGLIRGASERSPAPFPAEGSDSWATTSMRPPNHRMMSIAPREHPARGAVKSHELQIEPCSPFRLDLTAWALRRRAGNAVDRWGAAMYERVLSLDGASVALSVTQLAGPDAPRLSALLAGRPIDQPTEALARSALNRLFGLSLDLSPFAAMAAQDPLLGPLAARMRGLKPPRFPSVFEALVNGIACQQLSLAVGIQLLNRLAADRGKAMADDHDSPRAFPDPEELASLDTDDLRRHGFSFTKARTIIAVAQEVVTDRLDLEGLQRLEDGAAIERLTRLRGIGRWTAEYVLLRGLGRLHVFPGDDVGGHNKLRHLFGIDTPLDYESVDRLVARWHPYAGVVHFHLLLDSLSRAGLVDQA